MTPGRRPMTAKINKVPLSASGEPRPVSAPGSRVVRHVTTAGAEQQQDPEPQAKEPAAPQAPLQPVPPPALKPTAPLEPPTTPRRIRVTPIQVTAVDVPQGPRHPAGEDPAFAVLNNLMIEVEGNDRELARMNHLKKENACLTALLEEYQQRFEEGTRLLQEHYEEEVLHLVKTYRAINRARKQKRKEEDQQRSGEHNRNRLQMSRKTAANRLWAMDVEEEAEDKQYNASVLDTSPFRSAYGWSVAASNTKREPVIHVGEDGSVDPEKLLPAQLHRHTCREDEFKTMFVYQVLPDAVKAVLVCLPDDISFDFQAWCLKNSVTLPVLEVTDVGDPCPDFIAHGADVRTDLPLFWLWRDGEVVTEKTDITSYWASNFTGTLLASSCHIELMLQEMGVSIGHQALGRAIPPMFVTNAKLNDHGVFTDRQLVVWMTPVPRAQAELLKSLRGVSSLVCPPLHIGNPAELGIESLDKPELGEALPIGIGEVPVFWPSCYGTVVWTLSELRSRVTAAVTNAPGYEFVTDLKVDDPAFKCRDADLAPM